MLSQNRTLRFFFVILFLGFFIAQYCFSNKLPLPQENNKDALDLLYEITTKKLGFDSIQTNLPELTSLLDRKNSEEISIFKRKNFNSFLDTVYEVSALDSPAIEYLKNLNNPPFLITFNEFYFRTLAQIQLKTEDIYYSLSSKKRIEYLLKLSIINQQISNTKSQLLFKTIDLYNFLQSNKDKKLYWQTIDRMLKTVDLKASESGNQMIQRSPYGIITQPGATLNRLNWQRAHESNQEIKTLATNTISDIENVPDRYQHPKNRLEMYIKATGSKITDSTALASEYFFNAFETEDKHLKIKYYTEFIKMNPLFSPSYYNRGIAYFETDQYDKAIQDFNKSIELEPNSALTYLYRGQCRQKLGEYDRAITDYTISIAYDPHPIDAYLSRGSCYQKKEDYASALRDYNRVLRHEPDNFSALLNRGYCHQQTNQKEKAISDYKRVIEISPTVASAYYNLGSIYWADQKWDEVIEMWEKCLELDPDNQYILDNLPTAKVNAILAKKKRKRIYKVKPEKEE